MNKFSLGIFLDIHPEGREKWQQNIDFINSVEGINHLEIWLESNLTDDDIQFLQSKLSKYQLIIHGPFLNLSLLSDHSSVNQTSLEIFKNAIDTSVKLNAKLITVHAGKYPKFFDKQKVFSIFEENFSELTNYANNKIIVTTENMDSSHGAHISFPTVVDFSDIKKITPNVKFTLDIGHCILESSDLYYFLKTYKDDIKNIHIHNAFKNGKSHFGLQLPGDLNTKKIINFLNEIDYQGFLTIEVLTNEDKIESVKLIQS